MSDELHGYRAFSEETEYFQEKTELFASESGTSATFSQTDQYTEVSEPQIMVI